MLTYMITYYLKEESHSCSCGDNHGEDHHHHHERDDYEIKAHIKTLGAWAHFIPTSFIVKSEMRAKDILEKLKTHVEEGDLIFVTKVDKEEVATLNDQVIEWIRE